MTTIVCDTESMASDSMCSDELTKCSVVKIYRIRGQLIGIAGVYAHCMTFIEYLKAGDEEADHPDMDGVFAIVLTNKGAIWMYDGHPTAYQVKDGFAAIGSGSQAALAAMHCGLSPKCAVRIAAKIDPRTGGRIVEKRIQSRNN